VNSRKVLPTLVHNRGLIHLSLIIDAKPRGKGEKTENERIRVGKSIVIQ